MTGKKKSAYEQEHDWMCRCMAEDLRQKDWHSFACGAIRSITQCGLDGEIKPDVALCKIKGVLDALDHAPIRNSAKQKERGEAR